MTVDLTKVTALAGEDPRAARILATAEADRVTAAQATLAADAAVERQLRVEAARLELAGSKRAAALEERAAAADLRRTDRAARRTDRQTTRAARRAWIAARVDYVRLNSASVYSTTIYALAAGGAVYGQLSAATGRGWPLIVGIAGAAAIEGLALSMALTAHQLRLAGERALAPRALTWLCAAIASAINYWGHAATDQVGAIMLASLSLAAITTWEIRSGAKHRKTLRALGAIPDPPAQFGWRRWIRYPLSTLAAWSRDVQSRLSPRAAELLAQVDQDRHRRLVVKLARRELRAARSRKDGSAVVAVLLRLSEMTGPAVVVDPPAAPEPAAALNGGASGKRRANPPTEPAPDTTPARPPSPDVSELLPAGRTVRARLTDLGQPLTRDALLAGLRSDGVPCSTGRASALLAALNGKPASATNGRATNGRN